MSALEGFHCIHYVYIYTSSLLQEIANSCTLPCFFNDDSHHCVIDQPQVRVKGVGGLEEWSEVPIEEG